MYCWASWVEFSLVLNKGLIISNCLFMQDGLFLKSTLNWYLTQTHILFCCKGKQVSLGLHFPLLHNATSIIKEKCHRIIRLLCVFTTLFCQITETLCKLFAWNKTSMAFVKYQARLNCFSYIAVMQDFTLFATKYSVNVNVLGVFCMWPVCTYSWCHPQTVKWPVHKAICQEAKSRFRPKRPLRPKGSAAGRGTEARDGSYQKSLKAKATL